MLWLRSKSSVYLVFTVLLALITVMFGWHLWKASRYRYDCRYASHELFRSVGYENPQTAIHLLQSCPQIDLTWGSTPIYVRVLTARDRPYPSLVAEIASREPGYLFVDKYDLTTLEYWERVPNPQQAWSVLASVPRGDRIKGGKLAAGLMQALLTHNEDLAKRLLSEGADPNAHDNCGVTALMVAIELHEDEAVKILLAKGAKTNAITIYGRTAGMMAARADNFDALAKLNPTRSDLERRSQHGINALYEAASFDSLSCVSYLLGRHVNVNIRGPGGETPLMVAISINNAVMVAQLLKHGANPLLTDSNKDCALCARNIDIMRMLVARGLNVNTPNSFGETPLMCASANGFTEGMNFLLQHGAAVNARDRNGSTALMYAAMWGRRDAVTRVLIRAGADPRMKDRAGKKARDYYIGFVGANSGHTPFDNK